MIQAGTFREDLYYRLMQYPIQVPPLRERTQDVFLLAEHFRDAFSKKHGLEPRPFSPASKSFLISYSWPGNVRELKNAVERALLISEQEHIEPDDLVLPASQMLQAANSSGQSTSPSTPQAKTSAPFHEQTLEPSSHPADPIARIHSQQSADDIVPLEDLKIMAVEHAYELCGGNINKASLKLGITRSTVYRLLRKRDDN